jgi:hypothetical protein
MRGGRCRSHATVAVTSRGSRALGGSGVWGLGRPRAGRVDIEAAPWGGGPAIDRGAAAQAAGPPGGAGRVSAKATGAVRPMDTGTFGRAAPSHGAFGLAGRGAARFHLGFLPRRSSGGRRGGLLGARGFSAATFEVSRRTCAASRGRGTSAPASPGWRLSPGPRARSRLLARAGSACGRASSSHGADSTRFRGIVHLALDRPVPRVWRRFSEG